MDRPDLTGARLPFVVRLSVPVGAVVERRGWLVRGPAGWGECSPLPSWSEEECAAAERSAEEAASQAFPAPFEPGRAVNVNAMVPRVSPADAARLARGSGCRTVKVKVGDELGIERVAAVRDAVGPSVRIRLDANGAWADAEAAEADAPRPEAAGGAPAEEPPPPDAPAEPSTPTAGPE